MVNLYDLIQNIHKRPAMYSGRPSIANLRTFLAGYCFARRELGIPQTPQEQAFSKFQPWIEQKFSLADHQTWEQIILGFFQDEHSGLEQFFQLFAEFTQIDSDSEQEISLTGTSLVLIFMTHDTNLLSNKLFRKDQIWFTEKNKYGATDLYSLVEYKINDDDFSELDYIKGRYGAIPFIGDLTQIIGDNNE